MRYASRNTPRALFGCRRGRIIGALVVPIVLLAACGSDGTGTRPTITATLPPDASVPTPTGPPGADATTPPADTQPPETQPPETQPPEAQPAEPTEAVAAPATAPSSTVAPGDDGDSTVWWPWVLGALLVIGVVVAFTRRRRPGPSWQVRTTALLDEIEQLTNHLAVIDPSGLQAVAQSDAMSLATMRATLGDVVASAPDTTKQMTLNGLTTPLAELHGAVDAIAMSPDPSMPAQGASVPQLAARLHTAAASVRADLALHP